MTIAIGRITAMLGLCLLMACAPARTTRTTPEDFQEMAAQMAASLSRSPAILDRTADSPPWVISVQKVTNLTTDVMTPSQQWYVIARLRNSLPIQKLWDGKRISFIIPAEQVQRMRADPDIGLDSGNMNADFGSQRQPTHVMTAVFRSATRAQAQVRTDLYYAEFEIMELAGGLPVWTDRFEYKRQAFGHVWD